MRFYERTENQAYLMKAYHYLGTLFLNWGNTNEAIHWFEKCRGLAKKSPLRSSFHSVNNNLALVNFRIGNFEKGKKYLDFNYKEIELMNDELKANFFNLLGNYHIKKSDKDSVKTCYDLALNHALITRNNRIISSAYTNYAIYNFDIDLNLSLQYFDSSLLFAKKSLFTDRISESLYNIGFWYYSVNELDNAILNFEQSFFYASENSSYSNMIDAKEELLTIYRDLENWDKVDQIHLQILNIKNQQFKELIDAMNEIENFEIAFNSIKSPENSNNAESVFSSQSVIISLFAIVVIQLTLIIILVKKLMS